MYENTNPNSPFGLFLTEEGFVTNRSNPYSVLEPKDVLKEMEALKTFSIALKRKPPILLDITGLVKMNRASREMVSNFKFEDFISSGALVARNDIAHLIGNFVLSAISTDVPLKMFRDKMKARLWLLEKMKEDQS